MPVPYGQYRLVNPDGVGGLRRVSRRLRRLALPCADTEDREGEVDDIASCGQTALSDLFHTTEREARRFSWRDVT